MLAIDYRLGVSRLGDRLALWLSLWFGFSLHFGQDGGVLA